jgi:DNA-binding transcriptional LysR family regulator
MELYQLRSFAAVAESGHLTRAADRLHISQPALSAQIKALEDELGVPLFERLPSGMELTPAGRSLLAEAQKVVAAAQVLRSHASAFKGEVAGRVSVGTSPIRISFASAISWRRRRTFPLLEIDCIMSSPARRSRRLRDGNSTPASTRQPFPPHRRLPAAAQCRVPRRCAGGLAGARRERALGRDRGDAVDHDTAHQHP